MATLSLGRLVGSAEILPDPDLLVFMYIRREAVLSSQIEGTEASLVDLLEYEAQAEQAERRVDVREIANYIDALRFGLERVGSVLGLRPRGCGCRIGRGHPNRPTHRGSAQGSTGGDQSEARPQSGLWLTPARRPLPEPDGQREESQRDYGTLAAGGQRSDEHARGDRNAPRDDRQEDLSDVCVRPLF